MTIAEIESFSINEPKKFDKIKQLSAYFSERDLELKFTESVLNQNKKNLFKFADTGDKLLEVIDRPMTESEVSQDNQIEGVRKSRTHYKNFLNSDLNHHKNVYEDTQNDSPSIKQNIKRSNSEKSALNIQDNQTYDYPYQDASVENKDDGKNHEFEKQNNDYKDNLLEKAHNIDSKNVEKIDEALNKSIKSSKIEKSNSFYGGLKHPKLDLE